MALMSSGDGLSGGKLALANAAVGDVLSGKTFYSADKNLKIGAMTNHGAWGTVIESGSSASVPQGYHNGSGSVTAKRKIMGCVISQTGDSTGAVSVLIMDGYASYSVVKRPNSSSNSYFTVIADHNSGIMLRPNVNIRVLADRRWSNGAVWNGSHSDGYSFGAILYAGSSYNIRTVVTGINGGAGGIIIFEVA